MNYKIVVCSAIVSFVLFSFWIRGCSAEDTFTGIGVFTGEQFKQGIAHVSKHYDWEEFQVKPIYGKHMDDRWDLWVEGVVGLVNYTDTQSIKLGVNLMTSYDVIKIREARIYTEVGVGVGWCNRSPSTNLLRPNLLGFIDGGVGVKHPIGKGWAAKIGLRFHHTSSMFAHDTGINSYGVEIGLIK